MYMYCYLAAESSHVSITHQPITTYCEQAKDSRVIDCYMLWAESLKEDTNAYATVLSVTGSFKVCHGYRKPGKLR